MNYPPDIHEGKRSVTAIIVDDEQQSILNLRTLLNRHHPEVTIIGEAQSAEEARSIIASQQPDMMFLDIRMPGEDAFDLLASLTAQIPYVIFVTAYDQYAIRAIKVNALDYILKPISIQELRNAVEKASHACQQHQAPQVVEQYRELLRDLTHTLQTGFPVKRIALPTQDGIIVEELSRVIRFKAEGNYTQVFRLESKPILLAKALKDFELLLVENQFVRIHHSHIINGAYLERYDRRDGGCAVLKDGTRIPVSRRKSTTVPRLDAGKPVGNIACS